MLTDEILRIKKSDIPLIKDDLWSFIQGKEFTHNNLFWNDVDIVEVIKTEAGRCYRNIYRIIRVKTRLWLQHYEVDSSD